MKQKIAGQLVSIISLEIGKAISFSETYRSIKITKYWKKE